MTLAAATNENLAEISNVLIYSAMAVYTLAFFAYIAEWIFGSRSKVARTAAALTPKASAAGTAAGRDREAGRRHRRPGAAQGHRPGRVRFA